MEQRTVDFIIVGAGSAGSALANRLTENGRFRVVLLEAGGKTHRLSQVPISFARFINRPGVNWLYASEPQDNTGGRAIPVPRGRMLGGSSAINGMVWVRGQRQDYDHWAQLGNRGWSYQDVLPIFRSMESYAGGDNEIRGREGPLKITTSDESGRLYDSFFAAAESIGIKRTRDYNGFDQDGIAMTQASISGGRRMSTAKCYLEPARKRANLTIETDAMVESLVLEGRRCTGVRYLSRGAKREVRAAREVIVAAGSIASPQLLELSGIGQGTRLKGLGIAVRHDLLGVGENLRDHWAPRMKWRVGRHGVTFNERARGLGALGHGLLYISTRKGFLSHPASPLRAFFRTREGLDSPDAMFTVQPFLSTPNVKLAKEPGMTIITHQLRPESKGSVHISAPDPRKHPSIRFNFLAERTDRDCVLACMRIVRRLVAAPALAWLGAEEFAPGPRVKSDEELLDFVTRNAETTYHPVGTCRMGSDPLAVVDDQLRVHGIAGLRVADASIMPTLTSGNTNAPSIMIGEKAARMALQAAA
ncbi:GMC family oxidoreductase [Bradyrhizobium sp.]|uniref:GMC family oxidoreductase n=1 Tax=Bradyrhizobium sp. TaxID=376 RepID=UPI002BEC0E4E|nr:GMC family oxidoreductase N-terminal domain-containing protein [Bradyrhizobium sp.]HWX59261.1 GMC family oxidoreductase N-terminal domain-containing protein [Bradyrhizobium sp.]